MPRPRGVAANARRSANTGPRVLSDRVLVRAPVPFGGACAPRSTISQPRRSRPVCPGSTWRRYGWTSNAATPSWSSSGTSAAPIRSAPSRTCRLARALCGTRPAGDRSPFAGLRTLLATGQRRGGGRTSGDPVPGRGRPRADDLAGVRERRLARPLPVGPHGRLFEFHYGEGAYAETELAIQELLGVEFEPLAPVRPEDEPDALLVRQSDDVAGPYSGPTSPGPCGECSTAWA